ncbi:MAG TPA: CD3324 family protein [Spirochaetales bacterium]|nr:CD3324 family protein [Spirochaetales bacterium]HRY54601.1 CD3324 family protein [Spirochaetia bacterium]HRZ65818.1 CD3324 family protein [Spirochaetia bacterium]
MPYLKGEEALPPDLLAEIQKYVQGSLVYIPRRGPERLGWGRRNGTREKLDRRDQAIREAAASGASLDELSERYAISTDAVRKVLYRRRAGA